MRSRRNISVVIIDDEEDIRKHLRQRLEENLSWEILGEAGAVSTGVELIVKSKPEIIFLDIKLREGDAFDVLHELKQRNIDFPYIVLMTGYTQFEYAKRAINEYSNKLVMLLEKPFWEDWDSKENEIIEKITPTDVKENIIYSENKIMVRVDKNTYFIDVPDIIFLEIESKDSYTTKVCLMDQVYITKKSLAKLSKTLPDNFIQISRHSIINTDYLDSYNHEEQKLTLKGIPNRNFDLGLVYRRKLFSKLDAMSG